MQRWIFFITVQAINMLFASTLFAGLPQSQPDLNNIFTQEYVDSSSLALQLQLEEARNQILEKDGEIALRAMKSQRRWIIAGALTLFLSLFIIMHLLVIVKQRSRNNRLIREKNEELNRQKKLLEDSQILTGTLLDLLSHDLRNSAGSISGLASVMLEDDPQNKYLESIRKSGDNLLNIINQTGTLAELMDSGDLRREEIHVKKMMERVFADMSDILMEAGMTWEIKIDEDLRISAHPVFASIFRNFIQNAAKYADRGTVVTAGAMKMDNRTKIFISDVGRTIPEEKREKVFERKVRLQDSGITGMGLGLAISKRIADAHGADIGVEPNTPGGNNFYVIL